jgi:hypothetical protein
LLPGRERGGKREAIKLDKDGMGLALIEARTYRAFELRPFMRQDKHKFVDVAKRGGKGMSGKGMR